MKTTALIISIFSLSLISCASQAQKSGDYIEGKNYDQYGVATFAGGCFWCTEAAFERIEGVVDVISGYSGGILKNPSYYKVGSGQTRHAEAIQIYFDPNVIWESSGSSEAFWYSSNKTSNVIFLDITTSNLLVLKVEIYAHTLVDCLL